MRRKQLMSEKVVDLSSQLGISKKDIRLIICSFIVYKQREILIGRDIKIADLVEIIPEPLYDNVITTIAFVAKEISEVHGFTYMTVKTVIDTYIKIQREQLSKGRPVDFRGLVKIHPKVEDKRIKAIHSSISTVITSKVIEEGRLESVRVHTAKALKQDLYGLVINMNTEDELEDDILTEEEIEHVFTSNRG